jgi:hypothetical protein
MCLPHMFNLIKSRSRRPRLIYQHSSWEQRRRHSRKEGETAIFWMFHLGEPIRNISGTYVRTHAHNIEPRALQARVLPMGAQNLHVSSPRTEHMLVPSDPAPSSYSKASESTTIASATSNTPRARTNGWSTFTMAAMPVSVQSTACTGSGELIPISADWNRPRYSYTNERAYDRQRNPQQ